MTQEEKLMYSEKSLGGDGSYPVFVSRTSAEIYADDPKSHKFELILYNPYEIALEYQVMSTRREDFCVIYPKGKVKPRTQQTIMVHYVAANRKKWVSSKLQIVTCQLKTQMYKNTKDIVVRVYATKPTDTNITTETEKFEKLHSPGPSPQTNAQHCLNRSPKGGINSFVYLIIIILIIILAFLPTDKVDQSSWPSYLHIPANQKIVAAVILGVLCTLTVISFQQPCICNK